MKKIVLGKGLEERESRCNFCGEYNKECVKSDIPIISYTVSLEDNLKLKWFSTGIFGDRKLYWVTENKEYKSDSVQGYADICKDCIKQLAKLV